MRQDRLHLFGFEVVWRADRCFFRRHVQNLRALRHELRFARCHKAEEAAQGGEAAVPGADCVTAFDLKMLQEGDDLRRGQFAQR